jgi:hypothetical protein
MLAQDKLTNLQHELLKVFQYNLNETQLAEIRQLLSSYFAEKATAEMDKLWEQNKWDNSTMEEWAATHTRTSSKQ